MKKSTNGRRGFRLTVVLFILFVLFAANAGRMLVLDNPQPSDVIVALAGETDRRPERALQLLDQGYGRRVVINVPAAAKVYNLSYVQLAEKYIDTLPRASSVQICPIEGLSTRDESRDVEKCLAGKDVQRILIVTSDYHTRRALSVFQHELQGRSFSVTGVRDDTQFGTHWWIRRQWAKTCMDEWLKLLWWTAIERWS